MSGERLSKQQLQNSNTIKKLRASSKQDQQLIASQKLEDAAICYPLYLSLVSYRSELERLEAEVKELKETLKVKDENEEKYQGMYWLFNELAVKLISSLNLSRCDF